jgi:hypothetical protein
MRPLRYLAVCGGECFGDHRRYLLAADLRCNARRRSGEILAIRAPPAPSKGAVSELILLPSEPFAYHEDDTLRFAEAFRGSPAADQGRIRPVDGSLLTWHGTRLGRALAELPSLIRQAVES